MYRNRIARTAGSLVLASGGVVRGITNWGPYLLTKPVKKHAMKHDSGHHFIMRFDASPETQRLVYKTVAIDPRMVRTGMVRIGETLDEISKVGGRAEWISQAKRSMDIMDMAYFTKTKDEAMKRSQGSIAPRI